MKNIISTINSIETLLMAKNHPDCEHLMPSEIYDYMNFNQHLAVAKSIVAMNDEQKAPAIAMLQDKFNMNVPTHLLEKVFFLDYDSLVATLENKLSERMAQDDFMQTLWGELSLSEGEEDYPRDQLGFTTPIWNYLKSRGITPVQEPN